MKKQLLFLLNGLFCIVIHGAPLELFLFNNSANILEYADQDNRITLAPGQEQTVLFKRGNLYLAINGRRYNVSFGKDISNAAINFSWEDDKVVHCTAWTPTKAYARELNTDTANFIGPRIDVTKDR